jgi:sugar phosphate isomerase/epimerase
MQPGISTHILLQQRLDPTHLDAFAQAGARHIEIFASRHHFDYTDRSVVREIANWFRANDVRPTLHQPTDADTRWSRHTAPTLNLIAHEKGRRIEAMDEVKRALETAEQIPLAAITLHMGLAHDPWTPHSVEHALTAIEHLKAFASPLGVRLLLENLPNEIATPAHLLEIVRIGHFDTVGLAFDLGHAHLAANQHEDGILAALELIQPRIAALHLHDNDATADQHLWPGSVEKGGIDWPAILTHLATLPATTPYFVEISHDLHEDLPTILQRFTATQNLVSDTLSRQQEAATRSA